MTEFLFSSTQSPYERTSTTICSSSTPQIPILFIHAMLARTMHRTNPYMAHDECIPPARSATEQAKTPY